jgi:hypothetical protein
MSTAAFGSDGAAAKIWSLPAQFRPFTFTSTTRLPGASDAKTLSTVARFAGRSGSRPASMIAFASQG